MCHSQRLSRSENINQLVESSGLALWQLEPHLSPTRGHRICHCVGSTEILGRCFQKRAPKSENEFTQVSIAIALRKTFPIRLEITKFINKLEPYRTYEDTLRLDSGLRASYKALRRTVQGYNLGARPIPSQFELRVMDIIMNHYLSSLHGLFLDPGLQETAYAFSRKTVVESSLKIWFAACPPATAATQPSSTNNSTDRDDLARFTICGSGFLHTAAFQASLNIVVEIKRQIQEEEIYIRPDLFSVLDDAKTWSLRCIEAGETNIKTYVLMSAIAAQIKGLVEGLPKNDLSASLFKALGDAQERCLQILGDKIVQGQADEPVALSLNMQPELMEDWDFMVSWESISCS